MGHIVRMALAEEMGSCGRSKGLRCCAMAVAVALVLTPLVFYWNHCWNTGGIAPKRLLVIGSVFKNEADIMPEWLEHYLQQGVEHFYLIDNNSTDDFRMVLNPYITRSIVTLIDGPTKHAQRQLLTNLLPSMINDAEWILNTDIDEFLFARNKNDTIAGVLRRLPTRVSAMIFRWRMFGSSGHIHQPSEVRRFFTRCSAGLSPSDASVPTKWVVRTSDVVPGRWDVHTPNTKRGVHYNECMLDMEHDNDWSKCSPAGMVLTMNHYALMSLERFKRVKMTRGDVAAATYENVRTQSYFDSYDRMGNQTDCFELADLVNEQRRRDQGRFGQHGH